MLELAKEQIAMGQKATDKAEALRLLADQLVADGLVAEGYLDGLPPKTRRRIVLAMLATFAALALYTFGKAVYDIGRNDGSRMGINHAGQVELSVKPDNNHNVIPYLYGTDEE